MSKVKRWQIGLEPETHHLIRALGTGNLSDGIERLITLIPRDQLEQEITRQWDQARTVLEAWEQKRAGQ